MAGWEGVAEWDGEKWRVFGRFVRVKRKQKDWNQDELAFFLFVPLRAFRGYPFCVMRYSFTYCSNSDVSYTNAAGALGSGLRLNRSTYCIAAPKLISNPVSSLDDFR